MNTIPTGISGRKKVIKIFIQYAKAIHAIRLIENKNSKKYGIKAISKYIKRLNHPNRAYFHYDFDYLYSIKIRD
jgi:hypothetical protein